MRKLGSQYPLFLTMKYEFSYTDWQANATNKGSFQFDGLESKSVITFFKFVPITAFAGVGITKANIFLHDATTYANTNNTNGMYFQANAFATPGNTVGKSGAVLPRQNKVGAVENEIIANNQIGSLLYLNLELNAAGVIDNLTAGMFNLWINYIRMR